MSADGTWNLTMQTPMGERRSTLTLSTAGGTLTGKQEAEGNTTDITDGSVSGNDVSWKVAITNPMPLTLDLQRHGERQHAQRHRRHRHVRQLPVRGHAGVTAYRGSASASLLRSINLTHETAAGRT